MTDSFSFPLPDSDSDSNFPQDFLPSPAPLDSRRANETQPHPRPPAAVPIERRRRRRALISAPVRVRRCDLTGSGPDVVSTTIDVSRNGLLFLTSNPYFFRDMEVAVTFPYCKTPGLPQAEQEGRVIRVLETSDNHYTVAVALGVGAGEDLVDSCGRKLDNDETRLSYAATAAPKKPLVLAVDADTAARDMLKNFLVNEGYDVISVGTGSEAREMLKTFTPALLIAEVEGEDLPGFDLCAHIKTTHHLKSIPVLLTTRSGNPTDYANAHSLGAVVCMSKPYKLDRMGHVVRLLVPPRTLMAPNLAVPRTPESLRSNSAANATKPPSPAAPAARSFRFFPFRP